MPELSRQRRYLVLAICCLSLFVVGMDTTIIDVALPSIGRDFHAAVSGLQWTVDAYLLVMASLLMLSGSMGDRVGRRTVFQAGLAPVHPRVPGLLAGAQPGLADRVPRAAGGRRLDAQPGGDGDRHQHVHRPRRARQCHRLLGSTFGLSIVGGALVDSTGWRGVFWINIPVGIAAIVLTALFVPESRAAVKRRLDPVGQLLVIAALSFAIIRSPPPSGTGARRPERG